MLQQSYTLLQGYTLAILYFMNDLTCVTNCIIIAAGSYCILLPIKPHVKTCEKKGLRFDLRKFAFSNRVNTDWNSLSSQRVNCCAVNTSKNILQPNWNRKLRNYCVIWDSSRYMAFKPVLAHASCVFDIAGLSEISEIYTQEPKAT